MNNKLSLCLLWNLNVYKPKGFRVGTWIHTKMSKSVRQAAESLSFALPQRIQRCLRWVTDFESSARALTEKEREIFSANFNRGTLYVAYSDETLIERDLQEIRFCEFEGKNVLLQREYFPDVEFSLNNTTFQDCRIESGARVSRTGRVRRCILLANSSIESCGLISGPTRIATTEFGNGVKLSPGLGTGERGVLVVAESTLEQIARVSLDQFQCDAADLHEYQHRIAAYVQQCASEFTIICEYASVENCAEVSCSFIGPSSTVKSASTVHNSTLLAGVTVEKNSLVESSLLQSKVTVSSQAIVNSSLCCVQSTVDCQGKLLDSVLGPKAHLAEGEISSSLVGPMVGFHHQAMLIATYWPRGRGNVAYGANCGSNHTSRAADQSLWPGEGVFFGLGSCIKLPMNLTEAAYSIVATGVTCGPGRLSFPFSLITNSGNGECQVAPGWGIESNAYALERNAIKMRDRAPVGYASEVITYDLAVQVYRARLVLINALHREPNATTFKDDGANGIHLLGGFAMKRDFEKGLRGYTRLLQLYALRGTLKLLSTDCVIPMQQQDDAAMEEMDYTDTGLAVVDEQVERAHVQWFLERVFSTEQQGQLCKMLLSKMEYEFAEMVHLSKQRDTIRGSAVLPAGRYEEALDLSKDSVIMHARQRAAAVANELSKS